MNEAGAVVFDPHTTTMRDLENLAREKGRLGYAAQGTATSAGQVHWTNADRKGRKLNNAVAGETRAAEERQIASLFEGLPPLVRRTPEERFRSMFERLVTQGLVNYRLYGYPVWPRSVQDKLTELGWKERDPDVHGQAAALARQLFIEAGHKQQAKDQRKTALDWHGAYNHVASVSSKVAEATPASQSASA